MFDRWFYFAINEQTSKSTRDQRRIDWSYCAECMNCTACTQRIQSDLSNTEDTSWNNDQCYGQNGIYHDNAGECHTELLSDTSLEIFYKNYHAYGIGAMVIVILYVGVTLFALRLDRDYGAAHHVGTIGMLLMFYNVIIAMTCLYMIFKGYQYQKQYIDDGDEDGPFCYVDTIGNLAEDILSAFVFGTLILLMTQWLFVLMKLSQIFTFLAFLGAMVDSASFLFIYTDV